MSRATYNPEHLHLVCTEDGLHLGDSILWLDSAHSGQLSFLSVAHEQLKASVPQVITTEETIKILEIFQRKPSALVCQYNRPFSLGKLKLELLPSGHALGGASLYLETEQSSLLYAPYLQTLRLASHRQMQLKKAKTLILGAFIPEPLGPTKNRNKEKESLLLTLKNFIEQKRWPVIFCQAFPMAQELTAWLSSQGIPLAVQHHIYKVNKVYEAYGSELGAFTPYTQRRAQHKVLLFPLTAAHRSVRALCAAERPLIVIKPEAERLPEHLSSYKIEAEFQLYPFSYGSDYLDVIEQVRPKDVYFFGPYSKQYQEAFNKIYPQQTRALFANNQPTLF